MTQKLKCHIFFTKAKTNTKWMTQTFQTESEEDFQHN